MYQDSQIKKTFVAYGRHSRILTHAYFRPLAIPKFNYQKYFPKPTKRKKKRVKAQSKKRAVRKKQTKAKSLQHGKKIVKSKQKKPAKKLTRANRGIQKKKKEKLVSTVEKDVKKDEVLHFNVMGESDPRVIRYQQCIQKEVDRLWKPPLGVSMGTECIVSFIIDRNGSVKSFKIKNPSKVLIYDLSIVCVGKKFKFDKSLWGKAFTINFRE